MIFFDLFVFVCFLPAKSFALDLNPEYDEVLITLRVSDMGNCEIPTIIHNKEIYLPIIDIFRFLKIKCIPSYGLDSITGFFINQKNNYLIDRINNRIIYHEKIYEIKPWDLIRTETNLFLKSNYFGKIFGLECTFNFRSLSVLLKSKFELPIIREMRIEQMRLNISRLKKEFIADTIIERNYPFFHFGAADWSIYTTQKVNGINNTWLNLSTGAILAGGEFSGRINYNNNAPISNKNLFYRWRYANNNKKIVRQIVLGRIGTQSISTIYNPVSGVQITNSPTINRKSFGTYVLSDHTEPGWTVELYVNNVLIDYVKADASGFFTFDVPLIYGNTDVTLHYYGPWGEEKISEQNHKIPYDFLPKNKIEYTISSGIVEDDENSIFSQARMNYGLSRHIAVGGGFEYLSSIPNVKGMPFLNTSIRLASNMLFTGEYIYGVRYKGMLSYNLPSNFNFSLKYTKYNETQEAVINNYKEELRAMISKRFRIFNISTFSQLTIDHHTVGSLKLTNTEFVLSGSSHGVNVNLTTYAYFMGNISTSINSKLALSMRLPANIMLKSHIRYDYKNNNLLSTRCGLEKHLFRHCFVNTSFEHNFNNNTNYFDIGFRYDFSFARIGSYVSHNNNTTTFYQSASGSLIYEAKTNYIDFNKNKNVGKGGIVFLSFLDINDNGKRDKNEPKLNGLNIRVNGGGITKNRKDSTIVVLGLEPYIDYFVELNANSFDYIAWEIKKKTLNIAINPNQLRLIEVPVSVLGEVSGMVYIKKAWGQSGQGGIKVCFYNSNSILVASTLTETDGYFYYLGLGPGSYTVKIDPTQLSKLKMTVAPDGIPITILPSEDGDIVDGLEFVIAKKQNEIKTQKNNETEIIHNNKPYKQQIDPQNGEAHTITTPTNNIEYRVQIIALSKKTSKTKLAKKYKLGKTIKEDIFNNYYIYTVGAFSTYEDAKEYSNKLKITNHIYDAFVVKFKNGKRQ
ncbi:hypothetical protein KAT92_06770 [Candidatus Babeliales bacterium]|nr:hypothetical protein [Candidatus Babeliales bacterium]